MIDILTAAPSRVTQLNPVAKLLAIVVLTVPLVLTLDAVSAGVALAIELALFPFAGLGWRQFWRRTWIVWLLAPLTGVTIALYGQASGQIYAEWFVVRISEGSLTLALATMLRVLAIALPSVVLFATVDPTDLADGLAQVLRLPARFVLGGLAGLRMVGLFVDDWRALELARRSRGVADRGRIRRFVGMAFALLVLSIRRGTKLAVAMEARGFGAPGPRTWARESRVGPAEWLLVLLGAVIAAIAVGAAVATGSWNFILGPS